MMLVCMYTLTPGSCSLFLSKFVCEIMHTHYCMLLYLLTVHTNKSEVHCNCFDLWYCTELYAIAIKIIVVIIHTSEAVN